MKSIIGKSKFCKRVVEYAIKENNNTKASRRYQTIRQQVKRWRDKYDGTVKSLMYKIWTKRQKLLSNNNDRWIYKKTSFSSDRWKYISNSKIFRNIGIRNRF